MKSNLLSNNFTAGELCEWMYGRTDTEAYSKGAKSLKNCVVRPFGGASRRSGTLFIAETKTTGVTRLFPFSFSVEDTFVIEVGVGYFRFYKDGAVIESAPDTPYELVNTYTADDIPKLKFVQSNDVLFIALGRLETKKLSRIADDNWTWTDLDFQKGPFLAENTTTTTITPSAVTGNITLTASTGIFEADHVGSWWSINVKKTVDDVLVQGVVQITAFNSSTSVDATVYDELFDTSATTIWSEGAWSDVRGYPAAITFSDSRLWLANTETETQKVWGSEVFVYNNFSIAESVEIEIPSNKLNSINSLANARDLYAFTLGGTFIINSGFNRDAITQENITAYQQGNTGSADIQANKIGDYIYYPQRAGEKLIEFRYSWEDEGYVSTEISMMNEDVLESGIKDMSLQETEDNKLYCVLNDGRLATLTRVPAQTVSALSPHETDGDFISVASIPNDGQFWDDTYVIVQRTIDGSLAQYIELFTKPRRTTLEEGIFCDSAVVYDGTKTSALTIVGTTATATGEFTADDVGRYIRVADDSASGYAKLPITAYIDANSVTVTYTGANVSTSEWALSTTTVDGLDHLEAKTVVILRDGAVDPTEVVASGEITLDKFGFYVIVGLPYESEIEPMPFEQATKAAGSSNGLLKRPVYATLKLVDTMGIKVEGTEYDEPVFVRFFDVVMGLPNPLFSGDVRVHIPKGFDVSSTVTIKTSNPLPMNVLSVTTKTQIQET